LNRRRQKESGSLASLQAPNKGQPPAELKRSYRVISISLYSDQASAVDETVGTLLSAGFIKANRSLVIQTAIQHLRNQLQGKNPAEVVGYFLQHQVRRPLARAPGRAQRPFKATNSQVR